MNLPAGATAKNVRFLSRCDQGGRPDGVQVILQKVTLLSATCSATAFRSSTCATRCIRRRWHSWRRRRTPARIICRSTATFCLRSTARISGPCSNMRARRTTTASRWRIRCRPSSRSAPACACSIFRSRPQPREIGFLHMPGFGAHRIWWVGGRYAYVSVHFEGFIDHTLAVVDVSDPAKPDARRTLVAARHASRRRRDAARLVRQAHGAASPDHRRQHRLCRMARRRLHRSTI